MMKQSKSFLTRCLALALALLMAVSCANVGLVSKVFAVNVLSVELSDLIVKNYGELTDAEKDLITSGYLNEVVYPYAPFNGEGLVSVDTDAKVITAEAYEGWTPVKAEIEAEGSVKETAPFTGENATYTYGGNAFSVKVTYAYVQTAEEADQKVLLDAAANLNKGLKELKDTYNESDGSVGVVVQAMPALMMLADGFGFIGREYGFNTIEAEKATRALNAQMEANGGMLDLQVINAEYDSSAFKTRFLHLRGDKYRAVAKATYDYLDAIAKDAILNNDVIDIYMADIMNLEYEWMSFKNNLNNTIAGLNIAANGEAWDVSALQSELPGEAYKALDEKLAAIESTTEVSVKTELLVAEESVRANLSMNNVKVIVNWVQFGAETVTETKTFVLPTGTSAEVVAAEVEAVEKGVLAGWDIELYGFDREVAAPEGNLTSDIEYVIDYIPKTYIVDFCGEALEMVFGSELVLEKHENSEKAYDYTVNGEHYAQGEVIVIKGETVIAREEVKAYSYTSLYKLVGANTDAFINAILTSGAVKGDETIKYHVPEAGDAEALLVLENGTVTGIPYASNYAGLFWTPYTYGVEGNEYEFSDNAGSWTDDVVKAIYKLELTNYSLERLNEVNDLGVAIRREADQQIAALNRLYGQYDELAQLDKITLAGLNGVIEAAETLHADPVKNAELRVYFQDIVDDIIYTRLSGSRLKVLNILENYKNDGLQYYYKNYADVIEEVSELEKLISAMTADEEKEAALAALTIEAKKPEYYEKITRLSKTMNEIVVGLTDPNDAIDLASANLSNLIDAFEIAGDPADTDQIEEHLALYSPALTAADEKYVYIEMKVIVGDDTANFSTAATEKGNAYSQADIDKLYAQAEAFAESVYGEGMSEFYRHVTTNNITGLVGKPLNEKVYTEFHVNPRWYAVSINGVQKDFNIENPRVELPVSTDPSVVYEYSIFGEAVRASSYKFSLDQMRTIGDSVYVIEGKEINVQQETLDTGLAALPTVPSDNKTYYDITRDEDGKVEKLVANVPADQTNLMAFAMDLKNLGYTYIAFDGEPLFQINEENYLEVSIQTLINAILADENFGSQTIIDLGLKGKGQFLTTVLQLGEEVEANPNARATASETVEVYHNIDFVLNLTKAPSALVTAAKALDGVKNYMSFKSNDGVMDVTLNLPEKVYEAYLSALLFTGNLDKSDINAINSQIAFDFFYDYITVITEDETVTAETFQNTLDRLDIAANRLGKDLPEYNLLGYQKYLDAFRGALDQNVTITPNETDYVFDFAARGKGIEKALGLLGIELNFAEFDIKEIENNDLVEATVTARLKNTETMSFEGLVIDAKHDEFKNKIDYARDLADRVTKLGGPAVIMLTDDVAGELVFDHTTILDLNGKTVGKITANANVLIIDSNIDNSLSGSVGALNGKVHLIAGRYNFNVAKYVLDGYYQNDNGLVESVLYTMEDDGNGNLNVVINSEAVTADIDSYIQFVAALAVDMTLDQFVNYYNTAALYVDNNDGYKKIFDVDFDDIIGLISSSSAGTDLVNEILSIISLPDLTAVINAMVADMLDFGAISDSLKNRTPVTAFKYQTQPWGINFERIPEGDYLTVGVVANENNAKEMAVTLTFDGKYMDKLAKAFAFLDKIVLDETRFEFVKVEDLYFEDKHFNLAGGVEAELVLDLSDYTTAMAIVLANGATGAKREALVAAVNNGDKVALKDAFDAVSVADVIRALEVVNRGDDFNSLAAAVNMNVELNLEGKKELVEKVLIYTLAATGKALAKLEGIDIPERIENIELVDYVLTRLPKVTKYVIGSLDKNNDGWYEIDGAVDGDATVSFRGYGVDCKLVTAYAHLKVNLFVKDEEVEAEEYLLGDVNLDGTVDFADLTMVTRKYMEDEGQDPFNYIQEILADVNMDGAFDFADVTILTRYYMEDAGQDWQPIFIEIPVQ